MNATTNAPCEHGWPARECTRHDDGAAYVAPLVLLGGLTVAWCITLGAVAVWVGRLAWGAIRAHLGG